MVLIKSCNYFWNIIFKIKKTFVTILPGILIELSVQEVNFNAVEKPLELKKEMEVKEEQSEMPF